MKLHDTRTAYGWMSIVNHWSVAALILGLLVSGMVLENMAGGPAKGMLVGLHKQAGVLALLLTLWRIGWRMTQENTGALESASPWAARARATVHLLLLAASVALPVSGMLMSLYGGHDIAFLGLTIPSPGEVPAIAGPAHAVHGIGGKVVIAGVAAHALAALKHHFLDRDVTLVRMLGRSA